MNRLWRSTAGTITVVSSAAATNLTSQLATRHRPRWRPRCIHGAATVSATPWATTGAGNYPSGPGAIGRKLCSLLLAASCLAGCATAPARGGWTYFGPDPTLRSGVVLRPGGSSGPAWRYDLTGWQQKLRQTNEAAEDACARDTGENATPNFWTGHGNAFVACMKARGWKPRSPL